MRQPHSIAITGASSGIGEALALAYAAPGVTLVLSGRDAERLGTVVAACRSRGATVDGQVVDVTDRDAMAAWLTAADAVAPLDLVIANAGVTARDDSEAETRRVFAVNFDGVLNTLHPVHEPMRRRGRGQLALMASAASFVGLPGAAAYCASKAAVRVLGESLRGDLAGQGLTVSVICPGFVRSRMTAGNSFPMPHLMDADQAATLIVRGLAANRARIAFPWPTTLKMWLRAALPRG